MQENSENNGFEIAIVGMGGRFPGANNIDELWENLKNGVNSIRFFSKEELIEKSSVDPELIDNPNYVRAKGVIENVEYFDAYFFGYSPLEAELMDPQLRVFYEVCWEVLEDAGCDPSTYDGNIGVYSGGSGNRSWELLTAITGKTDFFGGFAAGTMIDKDYLSTRISHKLDLTGPSLSMHTACSTALVGVDLACRGLLTGQCNAALVGGVSVLPETAKAGGYLYEEGLIHSADGVVRAFDAGANGVVFSQGAAAVLLKRLDDALAEGDHIYAVIKGFAANNDGIVKSSFSAPTVDGQVEVIRAALSLAEVEPETIGCIEAHGTGTGIGDPIEVEALKIAFNTEKRHYCALGSMKTNIGHLDVAAGAAGLIKAALMLKYRQIPPSLNFKTPNPKVDFENSPFFVNTELREWKRDGYPLRAGVSSFGVGGTNVHIVLEEAPPPEPSGEGRPYRLLLLSARSAKALEQATRNFAGYLKDNPGANLSDVAFTLSAGRKAFEHRTMAVCRDMNEAAAAFAVEGEGDGPALPTHYEKEEKRAVFMFPGQGSQYVDMARGLYEEEPLFREEMDRCFDILQPIMDVDLKEILYPPNQSASGGATTDNTKSFSGGPGGRFFKKAPLVAEGQDNLDINQTAIAQPVIFAIEYALAKLLMAWGIVPHAMIGHSIGEYAAACLAGVFSLEDALTVVAWRGKLMQQMPAGSMLSVPIPEKELAPLLTPELALAAVNGPSQCVVSGPAGAVADFSRVLKEKAIDYRELHTSHAFHSCMMDPILKDFEEKVGRVTLEQPQIPFISNMSGEWITDQEAADPGYWSKHVRSAVRFSDGAAKLLKEKNVVFIEVGPGRTLSTFIKQQTGKEGKKSVNLIRHPKEDIDDLGFLLNKTGQIWLYGAPVDWQRFYAEEKRHRLRLPTYPFQGQPYWIDGNPAVMIREGLGTSTAAGKRQDISQWFYIPSWRNSVIPVPVQVEDAENRYKWLIFAGDCDFSSRLVDMCSARDGDEVVVTVVRPGKEFAKQEDGSYTVDPGQEKDYEALMKDLHDAGRFPGRVIHMWNLYPQDNLSFGKKRAENYLDRGFYSLLFLTRGFGEYDLSKGVEIMVVTGGMFEVWGEKVTHPEKATLLGPVSIIPLEYPEITCCAVDIILPEPGQECWLQEQLLKEFDAGIEQAVLAYRGRRRLERTFEPAPLNSRETKNIRLKEGGSYLITGGLGGIGLVLARHLAQNYQAKLFLTGRSFSPPREEWQEWLDTHPSLDKTTQNIRKVKELEALGGRVRVYSVDAADEERMGEIVREIIADSGTIDGVIHSAGVPGGGMIQLKTKEIADSVLAPKVMGTLALDKALQGIDPGFFILCSSVGAVVPQVGQVDYFAANAFLDAYAYYKSAASHTPTISINWGAWQEVGMAVAAAKKLAGDSGASESGPRQTDHPLFDHYVTAKLPGGRIQAAFTTYFSIQRHWVMRDHRSKEGRGIVPGVTYLEMAYAAMKILMEGKEGVVEIRNVLFHTPLIAEEEEEKEALMVLNQEGDGFEFTISSRVNRGESGRETHVKGEVAFIDGKTRPGRRNITEIWKRCDKEERDMASIWQPDPPDSMLTFGLRWGNLKTIRVGENEGIALLELPAEFAGELAQYTLYPSLLDFGAAFLTDRINDQNPYIPYSYKKLNIYRPFPARMYSYGRWLDEGKDKSKLEFMRFDLIFMDEQGAVLAEVEEFTLMEIAGEVLKRLKDKEHGKSTPAAPSIEPAGPALGQTGNEELVKDGIAPNEGIEAFKRVLFEELPQVVVSTRDLKARMKAGRNVEQAAGELAGEQMSGPAHERPDISTSYAAPAAGVEQKLANIWQGLLGIDQVGALDDFFELGGDSLKASTMVRKIKEVFGTDMTVREIFNSPNIKELSKSLNDLQGTLDEYLFIRPVEKREYYPLTTMQERLYILNKMEGIGTAYNLPVFIGIKENPDIGRMERALNALILRHESLRTSFVVRHDGPVQVVRKDTGFVLEQVEAGERDAKEVIKEFIRPFDLSSAPLLRAGLVKLAEEDYLLIIDTHHMVNDATSYRIIVRDFYILYEERDESLPTLNLQFKDFSTWQKNESGRAYIKKQEEYWLSRLGDTLPTLNIFTDYPRPDVQSFAGDVITFEFDDDLTEKVKGFANERGTTLFMVLLAAFNILLSKYSGQEDIIVGTPVAGREAGDFETVVGVFINALALRNYPAGKKRFVEFLDEVKEHTLDAYENQGYPFGELIDKLDLKPDFSRNPVFDVELNVQNIESGSLGMQGQKISIEQGYGVGAAQLDISLDVVEITPRIHFSMVYCTKLFKKETIEKYIDFFTKIIKTVIENKEIKLADIQVPRELALAEKNVPRGEEIEFGF